MTLDSYDKAILNALQKDGRISNKSLAELVNLSESACLRRVRALEEAGLIDRYAALLGRDLYGAEPELDVQAPNPATATLGEGGTVLAGFDIGNYAPRFTGLATVIGYVLALTFAYNLYLEVAADQGLAEAEETGERFYRKERRFGSVPETVTSPAA